MAPESKAREGSSADAAGISEKKQNMTRTETVRLGILRELEERRGEIDRDKTIHTLTFLVQLRNGNADDAVLQSVIFRKECRLLTKKSDQV